MLFIFPLVISIQLFVLTKYSPQTPFPSFKQVDISDCCYTRPMVIWICFLFYKVEASKVNHLLHVQILDLALCQLEALCYTYQLASASSVGLNGPH